MKRKKKHIELTKRLLLNLFIIGLGVGMLSQVRNVGVLSFGTFQS